MKASRVYFPGLNGLRFFAALAVVFTHIELMKKFLKHGSHWIDMAERITTYPYHHVERREISWLSPLIANAGPLGVVFFFVLSGFLITYLLFVERDSTGSIHLGAFYRRRILRIWPLYYLIFVLGFLVLPNISWFDVPIQRIALEPNYWQNFFLYLFMLPNLAFSMFMAVPNIGQLWSIGVEEQFYLIWPWIIRKARSVVRAIVWFTGIFLAVKLLVLTLDHYLDIQWLVYARKFFAMSKLECMSFGAFGAWLLYAKQERWLALVFHPVTQVMSYLVIPFLVYFAPFALQNVIHMVYAASFLVIILNVAANPKALIKFRHPVLDYLGKISFGIYMYHIMAIVFTLHFLNETIGLNRDLSAMENALVYGVSVALTIGVSALSYHIFEERFIRMKKKLSHVISGENARTS